MEIKSTEFFRNIKKLPSIDSKEYIDLVNWEVEKITGGVTVNGVFFSGWLYWHLNHWWIRIDDVDEYGNDVRIQSLPELRDNEWIRAEALEQCRIQRKGYIEVGGRQGGKSEMEASYFGMNAVLFKNTQNVIVCGNDNDLSLLKDKVDFGLKSLWEGINIPRLDKTWRSNQIRLGYKKPNGDDEIWSYIVIRNAKEGNATEVAAGTTAKSFIMDEVGKYSFASTFKAAEPALKGKHGWRAVPILVGTGGSFDNGKDAEGFFYNPGANNFLEFVDENTNKKSGLFLSGIYRQDCKYKLPLSEWLKETKGLVFKDDRELRKIEINVTDKEKAIAVIEKERADNKLNPDREIYLKQIMYYPLTVEECFLASGENIFDIEAAKRQKTKLLNQDRTGVPVVLYNDDNGRVTHEFTNKLPISNYPLKPSDLKDAPVVIYEFPIDNPPYGLYTAGCLTPGEKVLTNKGLVNVEDVTFKHKLINENGEYVSINALLRYDKEEEDIYTIKLSNTIRTTTFTKEHPILISKQFTNSDKTIHEKNFKFNYENVSDIEVGDWVRVPNIYNTINDFDLVGLWVDKEHRIDRLINCPLEDKDFWWFIGLWLGDGWCESNKDRITITFNKIEHQHIDRFTNLVERLFKRNVSKRERNNSVECSFTFQQLSKFVTKYFSKYALNKKVPEWVKKLNKECKEQFILGYIDSDGCIYHNKKSNYYSIELVSINLSLLEAMQDIALSLGYISCLTKLRDSGTITFKGHKPSNTLITYHLRFGHNDSVQIVKDFNTPSLKLQKINLSDLKKTVKSSRKGCFLSEDRQFIYFRIKGITKDKYTGKVYNFDCESHTFLCYHMTTHNCDPYRQGKSAYSNSLGSVYIYKRMHDIAGDKYQDMFVASYCARPDKKEIWEEQARLLIKYYNARTLCENDDISFIEYMKAKGDAHYLEKQPQWLLEIVPNTTVKREYGVHRSASKIIDYLHSCLKKYMEESIYKETNDDGDTVKEIFGVSKIFDPVLLEEIIQYSDVMNADRIVAAELALAQALRMDPIMGRVGGSGDARVEALFKPKIKNTLFTESRGMFNSKKQRLFM